MKKQPLLFLTFFLITFCSKHLTPQLPEVKKLLHISFCTTGALSIAYFFNLTKQHQKYAAQKESYFHALLLESNMDQLQRANLLSDIQRAEKRHKAVTFKMHLLLASFALHLLYAGYHLGNKLFPFNGTSF